VAQRRAEGLPIVAIALIGQKSEQGFAVGADSGIRSVTDWAGKKFGYKGSVPVEFLAIVQANGLDPDAVEQVKVSFDPRVLSEGQVDILAVFVSNEPGQLERIGYPVTVFDPSDYDIPVLGLTYIASEDGIANDPEALERFLRGALKGIEYASTNVEETLDIILKYAPQEVREQQEFMLTTELARASTPLTNTYGYGWQTPEQWSALIEALQEFAILTTDVDPAEVFTAQFLEAVYEDEN
jgi:ABC-type nitrate/sulfonate/bicarbonate transport system substrate-binding protein